MIKISIVIPVYNVEKYLDTSLKKILNQPLEEIEIILVNDGSTDKSGEICNQYSRIDSRIKVIHKINEGSGIARNCGIELATGKYIVFIDADDEIEDNYFQEMYKYIQDNKVDLVICNYNEMHDKKLELADKIKYEVLIENQQECRNNYIDLLRNGLIQCPWNKIYRLDIIKKHNITFPNLRRSQDAVFNCRYFNYIKSYKLVKDSLYNYRVNNINDEWIKFPQNFFDISLELNYTYKNALKEWHVLNDDSRNYLATYFICDVINCVQFCFSPKWNYNYIEKYKYIKYIVNHENTVEAIKYSKQETYFTKYLVKAIKYKSINLCILITFLKLYLQNNMYELFVKLKKYNLTIKKEG